MNGLKKMDIAGEGHNATIMTPETIERELREIWKSMAHAPSGEAQQAVTRACVLNLIAYSPNPNLELQLTQTLSDVSVNHPGRIFILTDHPEPDLHASVNALCHFQAGGRKQVCCEQIVIRSNQQKRNFIPGFLIPLLVPDLPVVLWWKDRLNLSDALFLELQDASTKIVFDSAQNEAELPALARFVARERQWTSFNDLLWARLTPWRVLISGAFDLPNCREYLQQIRSLEIEYGATRVPAEVFFLIGWFGSRLKWKPAAQMPVAADFSLTLESPNGNVAVNVQQLQSSGNTGVQSVAIRFSNDCSLRVSRQDKTLQSTNTLVDIPAAQRSIALPELSEAQLLSRELEIVGHDRMYEDALTFFA